MNPFLPSAKRDRELTGVLLAILLSSIPVQGVRAEEEPGPVDHIVSFFKKLGEKDRDKDRAREAAPLRAEPVPDPQSQPQPKTRAQSNNSSSDNIGGQSLDTPPAERPPTATTKKKTARSPKTTSDETPRSPKKSSEESEERESSTVKNTQGSDSAESTAHPTKAAPDLDAARKELAELKRKVAAVEAQLAGATGESNVGAGASTQENREGGGTAAALPAPINPPRNVAPNPPPSTPAYESKKSFANGAEVTLKLPEQPANATAKPSAASDNSAPQAGAVPSDAVPVGTKTEKPGIVKSPHPPFNEIDVNGLQKGVLAKDPTTHKIFRVP